MLSSTGPARGESQIRPRKVAHLVCPAPIGGAETVVRLLAEGRHRMARPTEVIAVTSDDRHPLVVGLRAAGVPVTACPALGRRYLKEAAIVASVLQERGIELVHTHVYRADFIGYTAARRVGVPVVSTFHGETGGDLRNRFYQWSVKRLFRRFDAVICVSTANQEKLRAAGSDLSNVYVVPNGAAFEQGIDRAAARAELGIEASVATVGWIGRLSDEKGPDLLLDAVRTIGGGPLHVVYVGDGPMRAGLESRARSVAARVTFAGTRPNAARLLQAFDLIVLSSRTEGMPMVLLEAMSARVPVAAFLVGGIPTVLSSETGWPATAGDVAALGRAIANAIQDQRESRRRAVAAEALVRRNYSVPGWVEAVELVYSNVVAKR